MSTTDDLKNRKFGSYTTTNTILGEGGLGLVLLATGSEKGKQYAVKVFNHHRENEAFLDQFQKEREALSQLPSHPNLLDIVEVGIEGDDPYIVMEYIQGSTLKKLIKDSAPLVSYVDIGLQIMEAVAALHEKGVTHKNLKPSNIFVDEEGHVKVGGVGLTRSWNDLEGLSRDGAHVIESIHYTAPELFKSSPVMSPSVDYFSLGCILYEMVTGYRSFPGQNVGEVHQKIVFGLTPSLTEDNFHLPHSRRKKLNQLLQVLLDKEADKRSFDLSTSSAHLRETVEMDASILTLPWGGKILTLHVPHPNYLNSGGLTEKITQFLHQHYLYQIIDSANLEGKVTELSKTLLQGMYNTVHENGGDVVFLNPPTSFEEGTKDMEQVIVSRNRDEAVKYFQRLASTSAGGPGKKSGSDTTRFFSKAKKVPRRSAVSQTYQLIRELSGSEEEQQKKEDTDVLHPQESKKAPFFKDQDAVYPTSLSHAEKQWIKEVCQG